MSDIKGKASKAKKTKEVETKTKKEETPLEVYKVGDLKFKCHCCNHEYVVEEGIEGGVRFDLYATNKHKLIMACPKCKATLEMFFTKGDESALVDIDGKQLKSKPTEPSNDDASSDKEDDSEPNTTENNENTVQEENKQEEAV